MVTVLLLFQFSYMDSFYEKPHIHYVENKAYFLFKEYCEEEGVHFVDFANATIKIKLQMRYEGKTLPSTYYREYLNFGRKLVIIR